MKFMAKSEDTRNFLKLKDSESAKGVFRGDIYYFRTHWNQNKSSLCPGKDKCELCATGDKSKFRFRVNFVAVEGDTLVAKIVEQGWDFHEVLRTLNEGDYQLEKYFMKITRHGEKLNTSYSVIPMPDGLVTAIREEKLSAVKLNDLKHITEAENAAPAMDTPPPITDSDIPF